MKRLGAASTVATCLAFCLLASASTASTAGEPHGSWIDGRGSGDAIELHGSKETAESHASTMAERSYAYRRVMQYFCGTEDATSSGIPCVEGAESGPVIRYCADGSQALDPLYRRPIDPATGYYTGPWERVDNGGCPGEDDVVLLTLEQFRRLPLTPSAPRFQPGHGRALVNKDLVVYTDDAPQYLTTSVLGASVQVEATPSSFTWDFGDGSSLLMTTDPGAPYPDHTVSHRYTRAGSYDVVLTTAWRGRYRIAGTGRWLPVDGVAETTSPPFGVDVEEARASLVAGTP